MKINFPPEYTPGNILVVSMLLSFFLGIGAGVIYTGGTPGTRPTNDEPSKISFYVVFHNERFHIKMSDNDKKLLQDAYGLEDDLNLNQTYYIVSSQEIDNYRSQLSSCKEQYTFMKTAFLSCEDSKDATDDLLMKCWTPIYV